MRVHVYLYLYSYLSTDAGTGQGRLFHRGHQLFLTAAVVLPVPPRQRDICQNELRRHLSDAVVGEQLYLCHSNTNNETGTKTPSSPLPSLSLHLGFEPPHDRIIPLLDAQVSQARTPFPVTIPLSHVNAEPGTGQDKTWTGQECSNLSQRRSPPSTLPT